MIKINNFIFNENEIKRIEPYKHKMSCIGDRDIKGIKVVQTDIGTIVEDATIDDIEWNYGTSQETQRKMQKELCKSCYYRDTISNKLKELEKDEAFEHLFKTLNGRCKKLVDYVDDLKDSKIITANIAYNIKSIIQNGF